MLDRIFPPARVADVPQTKIGSYLAKAINNPNNQPNVADIWLYYPVPRAVMGTLEAIDELTAMGWKEVPDIYQVLLNTQLHETMYVRDIGSEKLTLWTHRDSAAYVEKYPVALVSEMEFGEEQIKKAALPVMGIPTLAILNPLPLPSAGMGGFILDLHHTNGPLVGYRISTLAEAAQKRHTYLSLLLKEMSSPATWMLQTSYHHLALDTEACMEQVTRLTEHALVMRGSQLEPEPLAYQQLLEEIEDIKTALQEVNHVLMMHMKPSYESDLQEVRKLMQALARDYYEHHRSLQKDPVVPLPNFTTSHQTKLPSNDFTRALGQGFGSRVARSLWNTEQSAEQVLQAPNGALLATRGENDPEQKALHQLIEGGMGTEGIKYMVSLMAAYELQTGAQDRKIDARVTLRQLLQFMGRGDHADDLDEQRKLMHYILYLSRTWVTTLVTPANRPRRRGRPPKAYHEASPLIVLEALKSDERGGLRIPEAVEFHLGKEYWEQMFGSHRRFFTIPTALILQYDSKRQSHEISLAFYLSNMINLNGNEFEIHFPTLLIQTGLLDQEDIDHSINRMRDAMRILYALEKLEQDLLITREGHPNIDTALASEFYAGGERKKDLSAATLTRIENAYRHFQVCTPAELRAKKRVALQNLLEQVKYNAIKFKPGPLIIPQIAKRNQGRQAAIEQREQAQDAARKRGRKRAE